MYREILSSRPLAVALTALAAVASSATDVDAAEQAGVRKMRLGEFTIVALSDGTFDLDADTLLIADSPSKVPGLLEKATLPKRVPTTVNAYLIDTGGQRVLIDAGAGQLQGAGLGKLESRLHAAGYAPETIDAILVTHLHPDHVGGIARGGRAVFPNATVYAEAREAAFWQDKDNLGKVDPSVRASFDGVTVSLRPYIAAHRFATFETGAKLVAGITAVNMDGHTVGHTGYRIHSQQQDLVVCGDVLHVAAVQIADPQIAIHYDSEPRRARVTREALFADAAAQGYWLAAAHAPFPGIGRIRRIDGTYVWQPLPPTAP
ncbi:MAG: MBL fold metallo-hydrolase [Rudaea sp.]|uniref:MBL fold metallo-hydrolase n=1 Tax=unclassified Rudaea TaxID=2627037 RepID=UPI0014857F26|nr:MULTISPECIES: MBL fold metallo-hydrolase [unclassified Rudaea]MBN8885422.1 MBL fold metallo-hydrolase [Rudaea sp.]MBR0346351.1 MBL fold metallo-hydrolase [Rudaea sp.]